MSSTGTSGGAAARATGSTRLPRPLRPFRHRDYRLLVASIAASLFASGLWLVAIVYEVIALGGGPSQLSLVSTAYALGLVLVALLGGVAADRIPRRRLLRLIEAVRIVVVGLATLLAVTGTLRLWQLAVFAFVIGAAESVFYPTYSAILPTLLPPDELLAANGVEGVLRPVAMQAAGPALAGVLVGAFSPGIALAGAAIGYGLALLPLLAIRAAGTLAGTNAGEPAGRGPLALLRDLREGVRYLLRTAWLFATLAFAALHVLVIIGPIEVLLPFAVRDQTGAGPSGYALVLALYGIGGAIGSVGTALARMPRRYLTVMIMLWAAGVLPMAVVGLTDQLWVIGVAAFVAGGTDGIGMVIWGTLLQRRVPPELLGRVSSLDFFVSLGLMPVSMALAGPLGEWLGIPLVFILVGAIPPFLGIAAILAWRLPRDELAHPL